MPDKLDRCVEKVKKQGKSEDSAWAICQDSVNKGFSDDFWSVKYSWPDVKKTLPPMPNMAPVGPTPLNTNLPVVGNPTGEAMLSDPIELAWEGSVIPGEAMEHGEPKGTIVAIPVPQYIAEALYMAGGEPPYEMHITLAYIENPGVEIEEKLLDDIRFVLSDVTTIFSPFTAKVSGLGRFSHEEEDVLYASVDAPELNSIREYIVEHLEVNGIFVSREHGFNPHITIKYIEKDEPTPNLSEDALQGWLVETIDVWHRNFRYKYNLHDDML